MIGQILKAFSTTIIYHKILSDNVDNILLSIKTRNNRKKSLRVADNMHI